MKKRGKLSLVGSGPVARVDPPRGKSRADGLRALERMIVELRSRGHKVINVPNILNNGVRRRLVRDARRSA